LEDATDEVFSVYNSILEKRSRKINADHDSVMKQALKVYRELTFLSVPCGCKKEKETGR
jgi:hypothetical protein